jgi:hypothetical protein
MSNISYLLPSLKLMYGDIDSTKFSDTIYEQALISGGRFLSKPFANKYIVSIDNITRNTTSFIFESDTPYIESQDELGFLLAALVILHQIPILGAANFGSWKTPDLEVNNINIGKTYTALYMNAWTALQDFLKMRLGRSQKTFLPTLNGLYPFYQQGILDRESI